MRITLWTMPRSLAPDALSTPHIENPIWAQEFGPLIVRRTVRGSLYYLGGLILALFGASIYITTPNQIQAMLVAAGFALGIVLLIVLGIRRRSRMAFHETGVVYTRAGRTYPLPYDLVAAVGARIQTVNVHGAAISSVQLNLVPHPSLGFPKLAYSGRLNRKTTGFIRAKIVAEDPVLAIGMNLSRILAAPLVQQVRDEGSAPWCEAYRLSADGILHRNTLLPWQKIKSIRLLNGQVVLKKQGHLLSSAAISMGIPNVTSGAIAAAQLCPIPGVVILN
ncbi:hypothetical protein BH11PLA1_BH11PLA1_21060 [soil metagenome]